MLNPFTFYLFILCTYVHACHNVHIEIAREFCRSTRGLKWRSGLAVDAMTIENLTIPRYGISSREYLTKLKRLKIDMLSRCHYFFLFLKFAGEWMDLEKPYIE